MKIIISKRDREDYGGVLPKIESLQITGDRFADLSEPFDLPRIPTISDLKEDDFLSENDKLVIIGLSEIHPKLNFDNVTPAEAIEIKKYNDVAKSMDRIEVWRLIKPFFAAVFNKDLGDLTPKMLEIAKRSDNDPNYVPTYEWLQKIAKRILDGRADLFSFNIDLGLKRYSHIENPLETLLILMKVQKEMFPKRKVKVSDTFMSKFQLLIQSHAELMIKLKISIQTGDDFFGSKYGRVKDDLKVLKAISYMSFGGKPLSIKQQTALINLIDEYKKTLEMIFTFSQEDRDFFNKELLRPVKDVKLASLEIYHTFDDSATTRGAYNFKMVSGDTTACEIINSIFIDANLLKNRIYKNGISMQHLTDYIEEYFSFDVTDMHIIRQKAISNKNTMQSTIIKQFFDILDKYIC